MTTTVEKQIGDLLDPILAIFHDRLTATIAGHAASVYLRGAAEMTSWGRTKLRDLPKLFEGPPMQDAINYANKRAAQFITNMEDETKSRLQKVIGDAIKEKRGIRGLARDLRAEFDEGLARDLRAEFDDMTKVRSLVIARTETADSLEAAFMDRSQAMGVTGKEWIVHDPCKICQGNADEGVVPIDHIFSSGDERPPAHPNCRCALAPAMLPS